MSETKAQKDMRELIESMANKINKAPALNGGFDRLVAIVEHIEKDQGKISSQVEDIHTELYEPDSGLFARVKSVESSITAFSDRQKEHLESDEKTAVETAQALKQLIEKDADLDKKAEATTKLKKIAGDDLERLESVIKVKSSMVNTWTKIMWLLVGGIAAGVAKSIWESLSRATH